MYHIPSTTAGGGSSTSANNSPRRRLSGKLDQGLGGFLGGFVRDIAVSLNNVATATTNYAVHGLVYASLEPYCSFSESAMMVRDEGDDIEIRNAAFTKVVLDMMPLETWKGHVSHMHVRNMISGYVNVEKHASRAPMHVELTARTLTFCIALPLHHELALKAMLKYPTLLAWFLEHFVCCHLFDAWYLELRPDGTLLLEMGRLNPRQTQALLRMVQVPVKNAYMSHAEMRVKPLQGGAQLNGCFVVTASTVRFDMNASAERSGMLDTHLYNRQPEGLATHRERTKKIYGAAAVLFAVVMVWNAMVVWWLWSWLGAEVEEQPDMSMETVVEVATNAIITNATTTLP